MVVAWVQVRLRPWQECRGPCCQHTHTQQRSVLIICPAHMRPTRTAAHCTLITCRYSRSPPCWYRLHSVGGMCGTICAPNPQHTHVYTQSGTQFTHVHVAGTQLPVMHMMLQAPAVAGHRHAAGPGRPQGKHTCMHTDMPHEAMMPPCDHTHMHHTHSLKAGHTGTRTCMV